MSAFKWTTFSGETGESNEYLNSNNDIMELMLTKPDYVRACDSFPDHEAAVLALPPRLEVLRIENCRIRTWPSLPLTIREVYAEGNDFFHVPSDMSKHSQLIVLELSNGRLEDFITVLPPSLARANVSSNALSLIRIDGDWPTGLDVLYARANPSRMKREPLQYANRIDVAAHTMTIPRREPDAHELLPFARLRRNLPPIVNIIDIPRPPTVYANTQNVHDSGVQSATRKNLAYLARFSQGRTFEQMFSDTHSTSILTKIVNIFKKPKTPTEKITLRPAVLNEVKQRMSHPYSMHGYHMNTVIDGLWTRICAMNGEAQATAVKRFEEEVLDGAKHCTNGFMVRLCNVLVGLDENIQMRLNPSEILQARVPQTMKAKRDAGGWKEGEEPWQWSRDCFIETVKDLDECEVYVITTRQQWLTPFLDGFEEEVVCECEDEKAVRSRWKELGLPDEPWAIGHCIIARNP
jgi:hypothetical protein